MSDEPAASETTRYEGPPLAPPNEEGASPGGGGGSGAGDQTSVSEPAREQTRVEARDEVPTYSGTLERGEASPTPSDAEGTYLTYRGASAAEAIPPRTELRPGDLLDGYAIEAVLGEGGMGKVFAVRDPHTGARYALKTLNLRASPTLRERFAREGQALARIGAHPNVVSVHRAAEAAGQHYLVMDLVSGDDLKERVARQGPLDWRAACELLRALCRGVAAAHAQGVLHRDLKPANVMFDERGTPKLLDFGIARVLDERSLTQTSALLGSPPYMAPELADQRPKDADARTDVYGLGAILYHALTGAAPYAGASTLAIVRQVLNAPAPRPSSVRDEVPAALDEIVSRAMAKEPEERFPSAEALEEALAVALEGQGGSRSPGRILAVGAGFLALGAALVGLAAFSSRSPSPGPSPSLAQTSPAESVPVRRSVRELCAAVRGKASAERLRAYHELCGRLGELEDQEQRDALRALRRLPGELLFTLPAGVADAEAFAVGPERWVVRCRGKERPNPKHQLRFVGLEGSLRELPLHGVKPETWAFAGADLAGPSVFLLERSGGLAWLDLAGTRLGPGRQESRSLAWRPPRGLEPTPLAGDRPQRVWHRAAVSPDGKALAIGGSFARVQILELPSLRVLARTGRQTRATYSIAWSPSGERLLTTTGSPPDGDSTRWVSAHMGELNTVSVWSRAGELLWERGPGVLSMTAAFVGEDRVVVGADDHSVRVYRLEPDSEPTAYGSGRGLGGLVTADHLSNLSRVAALDERRFLSATLHWNVSETRPNQLGVWAIDSPAKPTIWKSIPEHMTDARPGWQGLTVLVGYADGRVEVLAAPPLE